MRVEFETLLDNVNYI